MAEIIRMPLLSDTMKEGVIAEWHKKIGDKVKSDDVLAEVETDKATMEVMPYVDGTLLYIGGEKGKGIPVNGIMAIIGKDGEDISQLIQENNPAATTATPAASTTNATAPTPAAAPVNIDASIVRMPLLSDTMKEGKIAAWLKEIGDEIKSDDVIAEVETDKATMEVMPYVDGTLLYRGVDAGGAVPVNGILAIIGKKGTDITPLLEAEKSGGSTPTTPTKESTTTPAPITSTSANVNTNSVAPNNTNSGRVKASPLAKKIAQEKGIDLGSLQGSGDGGRIIKRDLENYTPQASSTAVSSNSAAANGTESFTDKPLSQMRKVIAQRLSDSKFSAPHFYLNISVKMDQAMAARVQLNNISPSKISFNDFVIKACAQALRKHKEINSSWMGDFIRENNHISIGTAVAIPDGLIVPVIKFADQKSLAEIAAEAKTLVGKARDKKLQPHEFTGNTFTISNLGMMDIDDFTAIINPPDACILAVGRVEPTPVVENNEIVIRNIMKLTLSCDHRVVDGAAGAAFLQTLKGYLENPVTMLI